MEQMAIEQVWCQKPTSVGRELVEETATPLESEQRFLEVIAGSPPAFRLQRWWA